MDSDLEQILYGKEFSEDKEKFMAELDKIEEQNQEFFDEIETTFRKVIVLMWDNHRIRYGYSVDQVKERFDKEVSEAFLKCFGN